MAFLALDNLTKHFGGHAAVDRLSLEVEKGEFVSLLGPSGCGKTTTLQMIAGFVEPSDGAIRLEGRDLLAVKPAKRGLGIVFQSYALFPHMTVAENVSFGLEMQGVAAAERTKRVGETLDLVGLGQFAGRFPRQLSGGQQQRVALARALITNPRVLLLDEPLSALDEYLRLRMRGELRRVQKELGITFVHVTHTQLEAIAVADTVVVMAQGHIEQAASARDIFVAPRNAYVARFVGGQNVLTGSVESVMNGVAAVAGKNGARYAIPVGSRHPRRGSPLWGSIRRDRIVIEKMAPGAKPAGSLNAVVGEVHTLENQGSYVKVTLDLADSEEFVAHVLDETFFAGPLDIGERVVARWSASDVKLLEDGPIAEEAAPAGTAMATAG